MNISKIEPIKDIPGYVYVWSSGRGWPVKGDDVQTFIEHMDDWYGISGAYSREQYENECLKRGIEPVSDDDIGGYGETYGDWGMYHYHTIPENRKHGIDGMLRQCRWAGIKKEIPDIEDRRRAADRERRRQEELERKRKTYPVDLMKWIEQVGGLEKIYTGCQELHGNNSVQLREQGRHFEWLIGHTCLGLGIKAGCSPEWWADWEETDPEHPLNRIAAMLKGKRIEPYMGKVTYVGYGEDCGDDVRRNLKEWMGIS